MRVLIGCEYSGVVRRAFREQGHDAWSCDFLPSEDDSPHHIQGDVLKLIGDGWDMAVFHPPCTYLAVSGMHWTTRGFRDPKLTEDALDFVRKLMDAPIPRIAVENPVSVISSRIRKPDQIIHPYMFGDPYMKKTCLWLKNMPKLEHTNVVDGREQKCWKHPPSPDRWKERSRTYPGIGQAMGQQWGALQT